MKRCRVTLAGCLAIGIAMFGARAAGGYMEIRIDAGANPSPAAGWNVIGGTETAPGSLSLPPVSLKDSNGTVLTGVTAQLSTNQLKVWWKNTGSGGLGEYAGTVLADGTDWRMYIANAQPYSTPMTGFLTLDGLQPESWQWYRIEMSASAAPSWLKSQNVTVNGDPADGGHNGQSFKADTHGYASGTILSWDDVRPDQDGLITLAVSRVGGADAYLNAMIITLVPEPSTAVLLVLVGLGLALRRRRKQSLWSAAA